MIIHNPILTGSFTVNGTDVSSITSSAASLTSLNSYTASQNDRNGTYATTGSNTFAGIQTVNSNLVVTGSITAQTLVVQTITSSVDFVTGSTRFGSIIDNTHVFTGSISVSGSGTFVSALSGTSATFSGDLTLNNGSADGGQLVLASSGYSNWNIDNYSGAFRAYYGASVALSIASTGAATFSSATMNIGTSTSRGNVTIEQTTTNAGLVINSAIAESPKLYLRDGGGAGYSELQANNNLYLNASKVGIGTSSPSSILDVQQSSTTNVAISFMNTYGATSSTAQTVDIVSKLVGSGLTGQVGSMIRTGKEGDYSSGGARDAYMSFSTAQDDNLVERMRITSGGNVEVKSAGELRTYRSDNARYGTFYTDNSAVNIATSVDPLNLSSPERIALNTAGTERMRITSGGYTKISNTGVNISNTSNTHELTQTQSNWLFETRNNASSPYGFIIRYQIVTPNNNTNEYLYFDDATAVRFKVLSNGGIANFQANNVNLSDERTKKDIIPLESYWNKFKAIEIVKFKYKDQTHDDFNIGVIAQQVELVAPEFIDTDGWDKPKLDEDGNEIINNEEPLKSVYTSDLHHATIKVLQEAMAKIETLETELTELKALIAAK